MPILFPDHIRDPQEYLASEALWRRLFDRIKCEDYQGPMWTQWMGNTFANGTPSYDGSMAIYSQFCEESSKGIKVWQSDPGEEWASAELFHALMEPSGAFGEIDALDITCVLTDENLGRAEALIRLYMVDGLSAEEMAQRLESMVPSAGDQASLERPLALVSLDYGLRKHYSALVGIRGEGTAGYDATPSRGFVINARMRFSRADQSNAICVFAQMTRRDDKLHLSYEARDGDGSLLAEGPSAILSGAGDGPKDVQLAKEWLGAIRQFAVDNRNLIS